MKQQPFKDAPKVESSKKKEAFTWEVPDELGIPKDELRLRVDFFHQATEMTIFKDDSVSTKLVSAQDVAHALASELSFGSGLLPPRTLWWKNTRGGPVTALFVEPHIRKVALQTNMKGPLRFTIPLPGLIFLCTPGTPPWVFAVKSNPTKPADIVYRAPLCNIFNTGRTCGGSHAFPTRVADMVNSFFISFFSSTADIQNRSVKFPKNVADLWKFLDKKKKYPMDDLVKHG
ncbi:hypothetical protein LCGC14_1801170, partial [marine sediment metagenome]